ncbi:M3 family oligoendopeptidase [bacterium]|nr:M3 family oligoendopeptidase [bacterium]
MSALHAVDFNSLPGSGLAVLDWTWEQYAPFFSELEGRPLDSASVDAWLRDLSRISDLLYEHSSRLRNINGADTRVEENRLRLEKHQSEVLPQAFMAGQRLKEKLLASGLTPEGMQFPLRAMRAEAERYREENVALQVEESKLENEYNRISGSMSVDFEGREVTLAELRPLQMDPDRSRREAAYMAAVQRVDQDRDKLNEIWAGLVDLRVKTAANAGCANFRDYIWPLKHRFDYTPDDCYSYARSVEATVVPYLAGRMRRLAERLGVDSLRPWDVNADPLQRQPLRPFSDVSELEERCAGIFEQLDPELGQQFRLLHGEQLDLANRPGKAPGGWCSDYPVIKRPHIFMNSVGIHDDVQTLFHEAGHAFHGFATYNLPYSAQRSAYMEFCEVASMAMELLAGPFLTTDRGGFYSPKDAARARIEHFDRILYIWAMVAAGDAFQHWIYENPEQGRDAAQCAKVFGELWSRYFPAIDFSGIEKWRDWHWQRVLHYYVVPFYYIEYGIAQLGAIQVWQNSQKDPVSALAAYKRGLALGGTTNLPDLYSAAGIRLAFDEGTFKMAVDGIASAIAELEPLAEG